MKPEQVPGEWVDWGMKAHTLFPRMPRIPMPPYPSSDDARKLLVREILAAVAPLIAAAERERCARVLDARVMGDCNREDQEAKRCAAAIRALAACRATMPANDGENNG